MATGLTPTSIAKRRGSPSPGISVRSRFGSPTGLTPESIIACSYQSASDDSRVWVSTASRPSRCETISGGTLPLRKPGIFISPPSSEAVSVIRRSTSAGSTVTSTRTLDSGSSFTVVSIAARTLKHGHRRLGPGDRAGAWLYTGPLGRLASFAIDLGAIAAALALYAARRARTKLGRQSSAA